MPLADLRVEQLALRVPGLSPDQGARLGRLVRERLAAKVATGRAPLLAGPIELRLDDLAAATTLDDLADRIAGALSARLGLEG